MSKVTFESSPKYVRENTSNDLAAQLVTYSTTTDVNFYIDGNVGDPIPGDRKGVSSAGYDEWRLKTPLAAGEHVVTASVKIGGDWYEVSDKATVYSLDTPFASYTFPNETKDLFRPNDNPLRVKVDDEFNQFEQVYFELYRYDKATGAYGDKIGVFNVGRDQCHLAAAGHYVLCDINAAVAKVTEAETKDWQPLPAGTYAVKLKTDTYANNGIRYQNAAHWSHSFTVDGASPIMKDFKIESGTTVGRMLNVAAKASDDNELESINFYITRPRSDGVCTGNEDQLISYRNLTPEADGYYRATFNVSDSSFTSGVYCVIARARDGAMSNSEISKLAFTIDHTAPTVTIQSKGSAMPMASTDPISLAGKVSGGFASLTLLRDGNPVAALVNTVTGEWSYTLPKDKIVEGAYNFTIFAEDAYGNKSAEEKLTIVVNPYVPGQSAVSPQDLRDPSAPSLIVPSLFTTAATIPFTADQPSKDEKQDESEVLGAQAAKQPTQSSDLPAVAATESGWKVFGIAWYWWALIAAILAAGAWWTVASVRRRRVTELA